MARDASDGLQFLTTLRVRATARHLIGQRGVTQDVALGGFQQNQHRLVKGVIRLLVQVGVHLINQRVQTVIQQARIIDDDMALAFVGLVDAEYLRADGGFHFISHLRVDEVFHRALFPVREQFVAVQALVVVADIKTVLRAGRELVQFF